MAILLVFGLFLAAIFVHLIRVAFFKPVLSSLPGPFLARFTKAGSVYAAYRGTSGQTLRALHAKYGPIFRSGPNSVSIADVRMVEPIYGIRSDLPKSSSQHAWQGYKDGQRVPSVPMVTDKREHAALRKPIANAYSMSSMVGLEPYVDETIRFFVKRLDECFVTPNKPCDMAEWIQYFAYDVIGEVSFGRRLGFLDAGADVDGSLADLTAEHNYRALWQLMPWVDWLLRRNPVMLRLRRFTSKFAQRAALRIRDRMANASPDPGRRDLLSHFLEAQKAHPAVVNDLVLAGYTMTPLVAGSDTTAVVLRSAIYFAIQHPDKAERLREESRNAGVSMPPTWKEVQQVPYLDAYMRECMRHHTLAPWEFMRVVQAQGLQLPDGGPKLPPGTEVGMDYKSIALSTSVFGEDVYDFRPERWLRGKEEAEGAFAARLSAMNRVELAWGGGSRVCLGKNIAKLEMYKVIPVLLQIFDMRLVRSDRPWTVEEKMFNRQSNMDVIIGWKEGKGLASLGGQEAQR